jgi:hypothetical protein
MKLLLSALDDDPDATSEGELYTIELENDLRASGIFIA